jgi:hypothetical protein
MIPEERIRKYFKKMLVCYQLKDLIEQIQIYQNIFALRLGSVKTQWIFG